MSYVIIHRPYQYLEPMVRQLFGPAPDVEVLVDRRWHDRRATTIADHRGQEHRLGGDRRVSAPMIDILVSVSQ